MAWGRFGPLIVRRGHNHGHSRENGMELLSVILAAALVALNLIGGGILVRWLVKQIRALEGTVQAQGNTISAQGEALRAADQTFRTLNDLTKAIDLEQWVKRYESHSKLLELEAQAKVDAANRELRESLEAAEAKGRQSIESWQKTAYGYLSLAMSTMPHVPRPQRPALIDQSRMLPEMKTLFKDWAEHTAPDLSVALGLSDLDPPPLFLQVYRERMRRALSIKASETKPADPPPAGTDAAPGMPS
jgi:hypothetical protein